jgi:hypothetical protein
VPRGGSAGVPRKGSAGVPPKVSAPVRRQLAAIAAGPQIAYYLGDVYNDLPITEVSAPDPQVVHLVYGDCTPSGGSEPSCLPPLQMVTTPFHADEWTNAVGCSRLEPAHGVPTLDFGDGTWLITRDAEIHLMGDGDKHKITKAVLDAIRPIGGGGQVGTALPMPPPSSVKLIDAACGARPGEHGPGMQ